MKREIIWDNPFFGLTMRQPSEKAGINPCTKCYLREVCDSDECGRKIHY